MTSRTIDWRESLPAEFCGGALTLGNFDGVHRAHAALLHELALQARQLAGPAVALTFDPHPMALLRPEGSPPLLTPLEERLRLLLENGADRVLILRTTPELLHLSAREFFLEVIQERLRARALVEGTNFAFGHNREGTIALLQQLGKENNISVTVVPPVLVSGQMVSSSRVRNTLLKGAVDQVAELLGRPYRLFGVVGTGQRRGRLLGFPTANLEQTKMVIPQEGVYAARAWIDHQEGSWTSSWAAAVNVGPNPTFGEQQRKVEAHLIGFTGDLYGRPLALDFVSRLRDTRPFSGVDELVTQLTRDVAQAKEMVQVTSERSERDEHG